MDDGLPVTLARRLTGRQRKALDAVLGVVLAGTSVPVAARDLALHGPRGAAVAVAAFTAVAVASMSALARRYWPRTVLVAVIVAESVLMAMRIRLPAELAAGFAIYSLAATAERPLPAWVASSALTPLVLCGVVAWDGEAIFAVILASGSVLVGWLAGENSRARRGFEVALAERERERVRRTAIEEKARIARELHDVVAHAMSVIAVRSGVARMNGDSQPDRAVEALRIIETISRRALGELRSIVALLRQEGDAASAPAPGLADIPELVAQIAAAGIRVDVRVEGQARSLPPTEDLSAYRIAQEALTNVVRHSGADEATLYIRYLPGTVEIECRDPGGAPGHTARGSQGAGHGIAGMRERVTIYGGEFSASSASPGFRVLARLPVPLAGGPAEG